MVIGELTPDLLRQIKLVLHNTGGFVRLSLTAVAMLVVSIPVAMSTAALLTMVVRRWSPLLLSNLDNPIINSL